MASSKIILPFPLLYDLLSNKTSFRKTIMRGNDPPLILYEPVFISGEDYIRKIFQISPMDTSNAIFERHLSTPLSTEYASTSSSAC